jgi:hypothetical protein
LVSWLPAWLAGHHTARRGPFSGSNTTAINRLPTPEHPGLRPVHTCEVRAYPVFRQATTATIWACGPCYHPAFVALGGHRRGERLGVVRCERSVPVYAIQCWAYGGGTPKSLQIFFARLSLISAWRGTLEIFLVD